ncbi:hypothetical protein FH972_013216 [Carpinus fangiana]|uniref:Protein kinase domain-containing protein n=1 Tax=Carpinus fangiana TaxID=176857 RepID=A0A5N6R712_9ROSI|nr:hypothetical protein FH972_013216 [Carpinus fangiana]
MNNNSISGQIPPELSKLPGLVHFQFDNNHFDGTTIPSSYSNMSKLLKLSLRNCNLQGPIPYLSQIPNLYYLDLGSNQLNGSIPQYRLSEKITTISTEISQGGHGKVYKGILADGTVVAIKHAQEGSLQGEKEFLTEIEVLSRLHNRNLVSLIGYCDEVGEQVLFVILTE